MVKILSRSILIFPTWVNLILIFGRQKPWVKLALFHATQIRAPFNLCFHHDELISSTANKTPLSLGHYLIPTFQIAIWWLQVWNLTTLKDSHVNYDRGGYWKWICLPYILPIMSTIECRVVN